MRTPCFCSPAWATFRSSVILPAVFRSSGRCLRWGAATSARGASTVAMFNEKQEITLLFLGDNILSRVMNLFSNLSSLHPVLSKNPGAFSPVCGFGSLGHRRVSKWTNGGQWEDDGWADHCLERRIELLFRGAGVHPWILDRRNGRARGI